jgi:RHS repeat-associated protein
MAYLENGGTGAAFRMGQRGNSSGNNVLDTINLYNACLAFPLSIVSLPGQDQLSVSVQASFQGTQELQAQLNNRSGQSSVLGFGWSMPICRIAAGNRSVRESYQSDFYLTGEGGEYPLYRIGTEEGGVAFLSVEHPGWQFLFYDNDEPEYSCWKIIKEDGSIWTYGGTADSVETALCWDNWAGPAVNNGGEPWAVGWCLSEVRSYSGSCLQYEYENVKESLGDHSYTRTMRFHAVISTYGDKIEFSYLPKEAVEYQPEHTSVSGQNAHQCQWEDCYLDAVSVRNSAGKCLYTQKFEYILQSLTGNSQEKKRLLTSVTQVDADGTAQPSMRFSYGSEKDCCPGALTGVDYPLGEAIRYEYQSKEFPLSSGSTTLQPPEDGWTCRLIQGGDFTVAVYERQQEVRINILYWDMGWHCYEADTFAGKALQDLQIYTGQGFFAAVYYDVGAASYAVQLVKRSPVRHFDWESRERILQAEKPAAACGTDFFAVQYSGCDQLAIAQFDYSDNNWHWNELDQAPGDFQALGAGNGCLLGAFYKKSTNELLLQTFYADENHIWKPGESSSMGMKIELQMSRAEAVWSVGQGQASAVFLSMEETQIRSELVLLRWRTDFTLVDIASYEITQAFDIENPVLYPRMTDTVAGFAQNIFRYTPGSWNQSSLLEPADGGEYRYAYGSDLALAVERRDGYQRFFGLRFDPYRQDWTMDGAPYAEDISDAPSLCIPLIAGDYAVLGRKLFVRGADENWNVVYEFPGNADLSTVQMAPDAGYLLYQAADMEETILLPLYNQKPQDELSLMGQSCSQEASNMAGCNAFFTEQDSVLYLYHLSTDHQYRTLQKAGVLSRVVLETGFDEQAYRMEYNLDSARLEGGAPAFAGVRVYPEGKDQIFGYIEHSYFNGMDPASPYAEYPQDPYTNVSQFYSHMAGRLSASKTFDAEGKPVTGAYSRWYAMDTHGYCIQETRTVQQTWLDPYDTALQKETGGERSLIEAVIETEYEPEYFLPRKIIKYGMGNTRITRYQTYAWEIYPALRKAHLLDMVAAAKKTEESSGEILEATAVLWEQNADGIWREASHWRFDGNGEPDFTFADGQEGWFIENRVLERGEKGEVIRSADTDGLETHTLYDANSRFAVAEFSGIAGMTPLYCGFEPYERLTGWQAGEKVIEDCLTERECFSGTRSLELKPGREVCCHTDAVKTDMPMLLTCSVKTPEGQTTAGKAELSFQMSGKKKTVELLLSSTDGLWEKQVLYVPGSGLPEDENGTVTLRLVGPEQGETLVDTIFLTLMSCPGTAYVYQPDTLLQTAQHPNIGEGQLLQYDLRQRPVASSTDDGMFNSCTRYTEGSRLQKAGQPDETMAVEMPQGGTLAHFCRGWDFTKQWQTEGGWELSGGELCLNAGMPAELTWKGTAGNAFLLFFQLRGSCADFRIELDGWTLPDQAEARGTCFFVFINGRVQFTTEGETLFSTTIDQKSIQQMKLVFAGNCRLSGLGFCQNPKIQVTYSDYIGRALQDQAVTEDGVTTAQTLYDELGQAVVQTKTAEAKGAMWEYRQDFVKSFDWESGLMTGEVADACPDDGGYPYTRMLYLHCAAPRARAFGQPGADWAVRSADLREAPVVKNQCADTAAFPGCRVETVREPDGKVMTTVYDVLDNQTAVLETGADGQTYRTCYEYDSRGKLRYVVQPDAEGDKDSSYTLRMEYDFMGNPMSKYTPDGGISYTAYDRLGRLCYSQSAQNRKEGCIVYHLYDELGRETEVGSYPGTWDGETMQKLAWNDSMEPPEKATWKRRMEYDGDGTDITLIGKLWRCHSNWEDVVVTDTFAYDERGNTICHEQTIGDRSEAVWMEYDCDGHMTRRYVLPDNGCDLHYEFDLQGRMTAVYNGVSCLCRYEYLPEGGLGREIFAPDEAGRLERNYTYNSRQWMTKMEDDYFLQTLSYQDTGRENGRIIEEDTQLKQAEGLPAGVFQKLHMTYQYDGLGRLKSAVSDVQQKTGMPEVQLALTYDANGNTIRMNDETFSYQTGTNRLLGIQDTAYTYSENGAVTAISGQETASLQYDPVLEVLTGLDTPSGKLRYYYNGSNGAAACDDSSGRTFFLLDQKGQILSRTKPDGKVCINVRGVNGVFAQICDGKVFYLLKDQRDSVRAVYDGEKLCAVYHYQPFGGFLGDVWEEQEIEELLPLRFAGQLLESCGLYRLRARWYDPLSGRFLCVDPESQYASPYLYGGSDWINYVDPDGAYSIWSAVTGIAGFLLVVGGAALSICTAGIASPVGAVLATLGASALIGAGMGATIYAVTSSITGDFNWKDCLVNAGSGAVFGMISAGIGAAFSAGFSFGSLSYAVSSYIVDIGTGIVVGTADSVVTNGCLNVVHGKDFAENIGWNIMSGALMGGLMSGLGGLGHAMRNVKSLGPKAGRTEAIGVGRSHMIAKNDARNLNDKISHASVWPEVPRPNGNGSVWGADHVPNGSGGVLRRRLGSTYYNALGDYAEIHVPNAVKSELQNHVSMEYLRNSRETWSIVTNNCTTYVVNELAQAGIYTPIWVRSPAILMLWTKMFTVWQ